MKTVALTCLAVAALVLGSPRSTTAQAARLRYLSSIYADSEGTGLKRPEGVACGAAGQVVIGDTGNNRLVRFTYTEKAPGGGTAIPGSQPIAPARVQMTSKGEIYALDNTERRIVHVSHDGSTSERLTVQGVPPPATIVVKSFAIDAADNLYVLDVFSSRVLVLDPSGQFQKALALPGDAGFISEIAVDFAGTVLAIDSIKRRILTASKDATEFTQLGGDLTQYIATMPTYLTASKGTIYVVEGAGGHIVTFGRDGSFLIRQLTTGGNEGAVSHPSQICINEKDEMFVADTDNSRIQVFQLMR